MEGSSENTTLTEYINKLRDDAVKIGIKESEFWTMSIAEVARECEGINFRFSYNNKQQAVMYYSAITTLARMVGILLGSKEKAPSIYDAFPGVFTDDEIQAHNDLISANNFRNFAAAFNQKREEK